MTKKLKKYRKWIVGAAIAALIIFIPKTYGGVDQAGIRWEYNILTFTLRFEAQEGSDGIMYDYEQMSCEEQEEDWKSPWWKYSSFCRKVIFGKGIRYIGYETCADFGFLKEVHMNEDVEKIGSRILKNNQTIKRIRMESTKLKEVSTKAFADMNPEVVFEVPKEKFQEYQEILNSQDMPKKPCIETF